MNGVSVKTRSRIIGLIVLAALLIAGGILYARVGRPMTELARDTQRFRAWVEQQGWTARLIYIGMVIFQVLVAVIPGEPFELAAGVAFGSVEGTLLCLMGVFLGSMIVFGLVRAFGRRVVLLFFSAEKIDSLRILHDRERLFRLTAVLMLLPGTPKDLLTYCAGLTPMTLGEWLLICSVGRIPSVITSTLGGHAVAQGNYLMAAIVFAATAVMCGLGLYVYARAHRRKACEEKAS